MTSQQEIVPNQSVVASQNESLPPELLGHIASTLIRDAILPPMRPALLTITQVCRFWRNSLKGNPHLWCFLSIELGYTSRYYRTLQHFLKLWFSNALDLPLTFRLSRLPLGHPDKLKPLDPLVPYFTQLHKLYITNPGKKLTTLSYAQDALPRLESVSLFNTAIDGTSGLAFPWSRLTYLEIGSTISTNDFLSIFYQCLRLEDGCFVLRDPGKRPAIHTPYPIHYKHLSKLSIQFYETYCDPGMLSTVHFPALRDLSLESTDTIILPIGGFLSTFHGTALRRLCLANIQVENDSMIHFLSACGSTIEELEVRANVRDFRLQHRSIIIFTALRKGLEASQGELCVPLSLTSFTLSLRAPELRRNEDGSSSLEVRDTVSLTEFLKWWCECPARCPERKKVATISMYRKGSSIHGIRYRKEVEFGQAMEDNIRSAMVGWIYDDETCPEGLQLQVDHLE